MKFFIELGNMTPDGKIKEEFIPSEQCILLNQD